MSGKVPKRKPRPGVDGYGRQPLHYAVSDGDLASANDLLSAGADPSFADDNGYTPLHFAAQAYRPDMVAMLLEHGAVVDAPDSNGNTPLSCAVFESRGRGEIISLLRAVGADPMLANHHGVSPLSLARTIANFDVQQFFADLKSTRKA